MNICHTLAQRKGLAIEKGFTWFLTGSQWTYFCNLQKCSWGWQLFAPAISILVLIFSSSKLQHTAFTVFTLYNGQCSVCLLCSVQCFVCSELKCSEGASLKFTQVAVKLFQQRNAPKEPVHKHTVLLGQSCLLHRPGACFKNTIKLQKTSVRPYSWP